MHPQWRGEKNEVRSDGGWAQRAPEDGGEIEWGMVRPRRPSALTALWRPLTGPDRAMAMSQRE